MGVVGRTVISALTLLAAFVLYKFAMPFFLLQLFGAPGLLLYLTVAGPVVLYLLWRIWRPARVR
jgi:hypothetical protein